MRGITMSSHNLEGLCYTGRATTGRDVMGSAETFGSRFRRARLAVGMTQRDVGRVLDVRENDVRRWETDRNLPQASRLPEVAAVLGVSLDWLFGVDGRTPKTIQRADERAGRDGNGKVAQADGAPRKRRADRTLTGGDTDGPRAVAAGA